MSEAGRLTTSWDPVGEVWLHWPENLERSVLERSREVVAALCGHLVHENGPTDSAVTVRILATSDEGLHSAKVGLGAFRPTIQLVDETGPFDGREPVFFWAWQKRLSAVIGTQIETAFYASLERLSRRANMRLVPGAIALERAALETDGEGTALLTRAHWMRPGWNQNFNVEQLQSLLAEDFGVRRCLWLDRGLEGTVCPDAVSQIVRFIAPGRVLCQRPAVPTDPLAPLYRSVATVLRHARDAAGRALEVLEIPAPAPSMGDSGRSHLGFLRLNGVVLVPVFSSGEHTELRDALQTAFPTERVVLQPVPDAFGAWGGLHGLVLSLPKIL